MMTNKVMFKYLNSEQNQTLCVSYYTVLSWVLFPLKSGLIRHTVLATPLLLIQLCFYHLTSEDSRHYVLATLISQSLILLII